MENGDSHNHIRSVNKKMLQLYDILRSLQPLFKHFVFYFNLGYLFKLLCLNNHRFSVARESFWDF